MITLHLMRGTDPKGVYLRLPASPDEESKAFSKLDKSSTDVNSTRIADALCYIQNLSWYISSANVSIGDYEKLKLLAEQLIDGYMDFTQLGADSMEKDGVRLTKFGLVRRLSKPFPPEQKIGQTMY